MTLKFLALQGAPYIYDIRRLRVNEGNNAGKDDLILYQRQLADRKTSGREDVTRRHAGSDEVQNKRWDIDFIDGRRKN
jgi:hypothetical protein